MAGPWRREYEDALYHILSRGKERGDIFLDDSDRNFKTGERYGKTRIYPLTAFSGLFITEKGKAKLHKQSMHFARNSVALHSER
jgi:hypothetical protein